LRGSLFAEGRLRDFGRHIQPLNSEHKPAEILDVRSTVISFKGGGNCPKKNIINSFRCSSRRNPWGKRTSELKKAILLLCRLCLLVEQEEAGRLLDSDDLGRKDFSWASLGTHKASPSGPLSPGLYQTWSVLVRALTWRASSTFASIFALISLNFSAHSDITASGSARTLRPRLSSNLPKMEFVGATPS
jgi:hypothetical protein